MLLIGVDGFEWNVILPMVERGELPTIAAMMEEGNFGALSTMKPTLSPIIWTTIATGRPMEDHGILGFSKEVPLAERRPNMTVQDVELYDNSDRKTKAIWNIASDAGKKVGVIGWWMTYPAEPINGLMVSQTNANEDLQIQYGTKIWKGGFRPNTPGQVYPEAIEPRIVRQADEVGETLEADLEAIFGSFPHPLSPLGQRLWDNTRWSFKSDATYLRIALDAMQDSGEPYDLMCVYLGGPDVAGHRFWRYYEPEVFDDKPGPTEMDNLGDVIEDYYRWTDTALGQLREAAGPDARVLIVADHGMHAVNQQNRFDPDEIPMYVNSGHHMTAPPGVFLAAGPDLVDGPTTDATSVRRAELANAGSVFDVAGTVLTLLNLPIGQNFQGGIHKSAIEPTFLERFPAASVPTHDDQAFLDGRKSLETLAGGLDTTAVLQRLGELGYLGEHGAEEQAREGGNAPDGQ